MGAGPGSYLDFARFNFQDVRTVPACASRTGVDDSRTHPTARPYTMAARAARRLFFMLSPLEITIEYADPCTLAFPLGTREPRGAGRYPSTRTLSMKNAAAGPGRRGHGAEGPT
jgi:hypothetical protein